MAEQVAACLNIEFMRGGGGSIAPFLSQVLCEDLFPSMVLSNHGKKVVLITWERQAVGNIFDLELSSGGRQCREASESPLASAFSFPLGIGMEINWARLGLRPRLEMSKVERVAGLAVLALPGTCRAAAERGPSHTTSVVPRFHLKPGAGGVRGGRPYSVPLLLWCKRGNPKGSTVIPCACRSSLCRM